MPRDWRPIVEGMTDVQKLVHLLYRKQDADVDVIRAGLLKESRRIFENELSIQAARIGCPGRSGFLSNGAILSEINAMCQEWAESISNTFNYDCAAAILNIAAEVPTANRNTYVSRLAIWEEKRAGWKNPQIAEFTEGSIRALAQQYFMRENGARGSAVLEPGEAVCPICQGWIDRGLVPLRVALNNPPPYHPNCFPPDTMVLMSDGSEKRIDQIVEGDIVAGRCEHKDNLVGTIFNRQIDGNLFCVVVSNGRHVWMTGEHIVLTTHGWTPAQKLLAGDLIVTGSRETDNEIVVMVTDCRYKGSVFNLKTDSNEYIANGVVVHNCPHLWRTLYDQVADQSECQLLWMGQ